MVVLPGVVDPGYKGELMVVVHNVHHEPVQLFDGLRLAQFILMNNVNQWYEPAWGEFTEESSRGSSGFGSTGL
jgi:dUTP pyrophosphatase